MTHWSFDLASDEDGDDDGDDNDDDGDEMKVKIFTMIIIWQKHDQ